jgi:hypothetical protein
MLWKWNLAIVVKHRQFVYNAISAVRAYIEDSQYRSSTQLLSINIHYNKINQILINKSSFCPMYVIPKTWNKGSYNFAYWIE